MANRNTRKALVNRGSSAHYFYTVTATFTVCGRATEVFVEGLVSEVSLDTDGWSIGGFDRNYDTAAVFAPSGLAALASIDEVYTSYCEGYGRHVVDAYEVSFRIPQRIAGAYFAGTKAKK